jgi:hypothetical protein
MPDWWATMELNYIGAPNLWGRDVDSVMKNIKQWKADYVIIYQEAGSRLETKWQKNGFVVISQFSWSDYEEDFKDSMPFRGEIPEWWLLKKPD